MKYKILGIGIVAFIIFMLYLYLRPKEGINPLLFKSDNIDSIGTYNLNNNFVIQNRNAIQNVSSLLQNATKIKIDNPKGYVMFFDLYFYVRGKDDPIDIRIHQHKNEGMVLSANDYDYRGEAFDSLIKNLKSK